MRKSNVVWLYTSHYHIAFPLDSVLMCAVLSVLVIIQRNRVRNSESTDIPHRGVLFYCTFCGTLIPVERRRVFPDGFGALIDNQVIRSPPPEKISFEVFSLFFKKLILPIYTSTK